MTDLTNPQTRALLPCPFCGSAAVFCPDDSYGCCSISCSGGCEAEPCVVMSISRENEARSAWNTRAPQEGFVSVPVEPSEAEIIERCARVAEAEGADPNWHHMFRRGCSTAAAAIRALSAASPQPVKDKSDG